MRLKRPCASALAALSLTGGILAAGAAPASADVFNCTGSSRIGSAGHEGYAVTCEGNTPHERFRAEVYCYDGSPSGYAHTHYGNWVSAGHTSVAWCARGESVSFPFWGVDT